MGAAAAIQAANSGWQRTAAITLDSYHAAVDEYASSHPMAAAYGITAHRLNTFGKDDDV